MKKLPKELIDKVQERKRQELESCRQDTANSQNVKEWRESVEARIKALEDKMIG